MSSDQPSLSTECYCDIFCNKGLVTEIFHDKGLVVDIFKMFFFALNLLQRVLLHKHHVVENKSQVQTPLHAVWADSDERHCEPWHDEHTIYGDLLDQQRRLR